MTTLEHIFLMAIDESDDTSEEGISTVLMDYIEIHDCLNELEDDGLVEIHKTEESNGTTITHCVLTPNGEQQLKSLR